jgi:5-methylcytosine-specific restriction endonuclease McrA
MHSQNSLLEVLRAHSVSERAESGRKYTPEQRRINAEITKRWRETHPDYNKANNARLRAERHGVGGSWTPEQKAARWAMWGNRCWMCGDPATCVDHVKPLSKGGSNWPANLRPACTDCNAWKFTRWPLPAWFVTATFPVTEFYEPTVPLGQGVLALPA